jgi:hypothetical protein
VRAIVIAGLVAVAAVVGGSVPVAAAALPGAAARREAAPRLAGSTLPSTPPTAISCGSSKACLVVGSPYTMIGSPSGLSVTPTEALAWNGSRWRSITVPKGAKGAELQQASCLSATACVAVGDYVTNAQTGDARFYAMTWNGSALKQTAALPLPKGDDYAYLQAVSCVTARDCVALGYASNAAGDNVNIAEHWNGSTWTMRVLPATVGTKDLQLDAISCLSATYCQLAGQLTPPNSDSFAHFLGTWNGKSIAAQRAPLPKGAHTAILTAVSCATRNLCVVTGISQITSKAAESFTEMWNGKVWAATPVAAPKGEPFYYVWGVACPAVRLCVAVGSGAASLAGAGTPQALAYHGKTWSRQALPTVKGKYGAFTSVSCPSAKLCVALGTSGSANLSPLAGFWNGKAWRLTAA